LINKLPRMIRGELWRMRLNYRLRKSPPVFVFQMGKVASRGITEPLHAFYDGEVIHDHVFGSEKMQGETRELFRYVTGKHPPSLLHIISLVREPIARNVSAFFNNFQIHTGIHPEQWDGEPDELKSIFLERFPHDQPLYWFQKSIEPHFGIDVYSVPFPESGSMVIEKEGVRLLNIRMEIDDAAKSAAVRQFLGLDSGYHVTRTNERSSKEGASLCRRFTEWVTFDADFVDSFCESAYFRHFYSKEFIQKMRRRWTEGLES